VNFKTQGMLKRRKAMKYLKSALISAFLIISLAAFIGCQKNMKSGEQTTPAQHPTSTTP
jgi:hypothetical protein